LPVSPEKEKSGGRSRHGDEEKARSGKKRSCPFGGGCGALGQAVLEEKKVCGVQAGEKWKLTAQGGGGKKKGYGTEMWGGEGEQTQEVK